MDRTCVFYKKDGTCRAIREPYYCIRTDHSCGFYKPNDEYRLDEDGYLIDLEEDDGK